MKKPVNVSRRNFIKGATTATAVAAWSAANNQAEPAEAEPASPEPSIELGAHRISRLVAGANPLNGYSYQGAHATNCMKEYFTVDRQVEFLQRCERAGITAHQFSNYQESEYLRVARERGVKMPFFGLHSDIATVPEAIKTVGPIALVHHGGMTDRLFAQGKHQQVRDFVKAVHDGGILAGVSAHNPDCIKRIADEGWENDFFMTCFYHLTREYTEEGKKELEGVCTLDMTRYTWFKDDPATMTVVVRQVDKPCFGFKILGGGRACLNERRVREAIKIAFQSIKPIDGVVVGMFPRYVDEIQFNVEAARNYGEVPTAARHTS